MVKDHESEEMYLETILRLKSTKPNLRSVDIVEALGYAKSSVSSKDVRGLRVRHSHVHGYADGSRPYRRQRRPPSHGKEAPF